MISTAIRALFAQIFARREKDIDDFVRLVRGQSVDEIEAVLKFRLDRARTLAKGHLTLTLRCRNGRLAIYRFALGEDVPYTNKLEAGPSIIKTVWKADKRIEEIQARLSNVRIRFGKVKMPDGSEESPNDLLEGIDEVLLRKQA